jgi:predicted membrane-bound spermidine synthase
MKFSGIKVAVVLLFMLSGICGLIYEVAWSRAIALFIGNTAYAHMIVLATYMVGLALGAWYWGRFSDRFLNQVRLYGVLELVIGLYCLAYPFLMDITGNLFIRSARALDGASNQGVLLALRILLSFLTLIVPTFLMGGTIPVLCKFVSQKISDSGKNVAVLYYVNSLGAVLGTGIAGFFLIRLLGIDATVWVAALGNIFIGLVSILLSLFLKINRQAEAPNMIVEKADITAYSKQTIRIAILTAFASGFIAMLYELTWVRLLSNILGSTTYAFTIMLMAFIAGIAIGSFVVSLIIKKIRNLVLFLGICQYGTAFSIILMLPLYERLPYFLMRISTRTTNSPENFSTFLGFEFLFCFSVMLLPTIFAGMSLPVASRIASNDMRVLGRSIGGIFSVNTIGSVVGALITGIGLMPLLGVKGSLEFGVLLNGLCGFYILWHSGVALKMKAGFAGFFVVCAVAYRLLLPSWDDNFLISGVFRTLASEQAGSYDEFKMQQNEGQKILWYKEGVHANVAVRESVFEDSIQKSLVINGKADASTIADLPTQILLGQIPLMLYPNSGDALVVGLGSGITCGSVLRHPVKSLDVVEIASEVVECNYLFAKENYNFTNDARTKIVIDDAITHLKTSSKKYDYIISEPSNPWIAGIGNLYSLEYFDLCKSKLKPNGVLAQWFHTYDINNDIFKLVLSTISSAFPNVTLWKVSDADVIILASASPLSIDFTAMEGKLKNPSIAGDLARIKMYDVPSMLSTQVVSAQNNPYQYYDDELNTANKPILEFLAPLALFTHESVTALDSLDERFSFQDKSLWFTAYEKQRPLSFENYMNIALYRRADNIGDLAIAFSALKMALKMDSTSEAALATLSNVANKMGVGDLGIRDAQLTEAKQKVASFPNDVSVAFEYVEALLDFYRLENSIVNPQQMDDAVQLVKRCISMDQAEGARFRFILAMILTGAGRHAEAAVALNDLMRFEKATGNSFSFLSESQLLYEIGVSYYNSGNLVDAERYFKQLQSVDGTNTKLPTMFKKIVRKKRELRLVRFSFELFGKFSG